MIGLESLVNVFSFLNRDELARISVVGRLPYLIVEKHFSKAPRLVYKSLAIRPAGKKSREFSLILTKFALHGGGTTVLPASELSSLVSPLYAVFNELYLTLKKPGDQNSLLPTLCAGAHAFSKTSTVVIKYLYDPDPEEFEELMDTLPVPKIQRLEINCKQVLPVQPYFFSYNIFLNCRSVNISTKSKKKLALDGQDIVNWLHSNPSTAHPRRLYVSAHFTSHQISTLLGTLDEIFTDAQLPCHYFLQLRGFGVPGVINTQKNEITNEIWVAECNAQLQSLLIHRR